MALDGRTILSLILRTSGTVLADAAGVVRQAANDAHADLILGWHVGAHGDDGACALVRGGAGKGRREDAGCYHAVRVAVGGDGDLDEEVGTVELFGNGDGADLVRFVELGLLNDRQQEAADSVDSPLPLVPLSWCPGGLLHP